MPYAPGVVDRSGEILANGLNATVSQYAQDMQQMRENEMKRRTAAGQVAGILAANPELAQRADPTLVQKMSMGKANLNDTLQLLGTLTTVQQQEQEKQRAAFQQAQIAHLAQQTAVARAQAEQVRRAQQGEDELNARLDQTLGMADTNGVLTPQAQANVAQMAGSPLAQLRRQGVRVTPEMAGDLAKVEIAQQGQMARVGAKPMPGSQGYRKVDVPGMGSVLVDVATGEPIDGGKIIQREAKAPAKPSEAEVSFDTNIDEGLAKIQEYRDVVKKYGNWESARFGNTKAAAALDQIPYQLAIMHAKIADPNSVAREGEVAAAQKYMLPSGFWTTNATTLAALDGLENTFKGYAAARKKARGDKTSDSTAAPAASAAASAEADQFTDASGMKYPIVTVRGVRGIVKQSKFYPIVE